MLFIQGTLGLTRRIFFKRYHSFWVIDFETLVENGDAIEFIAKENRGGFAGNEETGLQQKFSGKRGEDGKYQFTQI